MKLLIDGEHLQLHLTDTSFLENVNKLVTFIAPSTQAWRVSVMLQEFLSTSDIRLLIKIRIRL